MQQLGDIRDDIRVRVPPGNRDRYLCEPAAEAPAPADVLEHVSRAGGVLDDEAKRAGGAEKLVLVSRLGEAPDDVKRAASQVADRDGHADDAVGQREARVPERALGGARPLPHAGAAPERVGVALYGHDYGVEVRRRAGLPLDGRPDALGEGGIVGDGPDGRPVFKEFGNAGAAPEGGAREPNVDTITNEKEGTAKLVVEMPGVERGDIDVSVDTRRVSIAAEREEKRYRVAVPLERKVDRDSAKATYKNGILEVTFRLAGDEKPPGRKVEVQ